MPQNRSAQIVGLTCLTALSFFAAGAACVAAEKKPDGCTESASLTQALSSTQLTGAGMPNKTLALTFDDGPGTRTLELSRYLREQGIQAAFFVNGKMLGGGTQILADLVADGHVIGNHTQTHADLTSLGASGVVSEVDQTDRLIAPFVPDGRFIFRPPFGSFNESTIGALEGSEMSKYAGPVLWDIGDTMSEATAADWACWGTDGSTPVTVQQCGDLYLNEMRQKGSGIVLMHDPYFINDDPAAGGTVDMIKYIVPILKSEGFQFTRVDMVPALSAVLPPLTTPPPSATPNGDTSGTQRPPTGGDSSDPCPRSPQGAASR